MKTLFETIAGLFILLAFSVSVLAGVWVLIKLVFF